MRLLLQFLTSAVLAALAVLLIKHGSSSAFELGLFLGFMSLAHPLFWTDKKKEVGNE